MRLGTILIIENLERTSVAHAEKPPKKGAVLMLKGGREAWVVERRNCERCPGGRTPGKRGEDTRAVEGQ